MYLEIATAAYMLGDFIYHRWQEANAATRRRAEIDIPKIEGGTAIPYIFGKVRVTQPILAWTSAGIAYEDSNGGIVDGETLYAISMLFVIGAPFADGESTNRIHRMWQSDVEYGTQGIGTTPPTYAPVVDLEDLDGDGGLEEFNRGVGRVGARRLPTSGGPILFTAGAVEFLNGNPDQQLVDPLTPWTPTTRAGFQMTTTTGLGLQTTPENMVGYRGVLSAFLYSIPIIDGGLGHFIIGLAPQLGAFSFEVSSYKSDASYPATGSMARLGDDSNPINVIYDILVSKRKLGISTSLIDHDSFTAAAATLYQESHGFSMCFDERRPARDMIKEVLRQVDGVLFEDSLTGKYKIKLIRGDYDPATIPHITKDNCDAERSSITAGGAVGVPNKIRVVYKNRSKDYIDDDAVDQNPANAVGQDGIEREEVLQFPGCSHEALAKHLAARELAALCRSIIKCHLVVDRSFIEVSPGDAVKLTWQKPDISGLVFRVVSVDLGSLDKNKIELDLIQDFHYHYRSFPPQPPGPVVPAPPTLRLG